ncbi:MAG TPA: protein-glutamate O-methyltransferase [Gammaproteobacteria bacterium]
MIQTAPEWDREFIFTEQDFYVLRELINRHTGICLSEAKKELVYSRLTRRLRQLKLKSFAKYCQYLQSESSGEELVHFINAVTTNLTAFFREPHHFEYLCRSLLPELAAKKSGKQRYRFWSAGCSTGEEPYSMAMCISETLPFENSFDIKILATDLDSSVLDVAISGLYPIEKLKVILPHRQNKWFPKGESFNHGLMQVRPDLQNLITFRQLNLMHEWPMKGPFDAIFCRNVVIYFDKSTQRILVDRFANLLGPGGYLFLGHSESLFKVTDRFKLVGQTIYQKIR